MPIRMVAASTSDQFSNILDPFSNNCAISRQFYDDSKSLTPISSYIFHDGEFVFFFRQIISKS
jgi:hypothetical protein